MNKTRYGVQLLLLGKQQLATMHASVDTHYQRVCGLPLWAPWHFLRQPLVAGGPKSLDLFTRASLPLASTYLAASLSRNVLAASTARYLLEVTVVASWALEGFVMRQVWQLLGIDLVSQPTPTVSPMAIHSAGGS